MTLSEVPLTRPDSDPALVATEFSQAMTEISREAAL